MSASDFGGMGAAPAVDSQPAITASGDSQWGLAKRVGFRFISFYLFLYCFPFPLGYLPLLGRLEDLYASVWFVIVPWVGKHILRLSYEITVLPNGSGDTTFNYVQVLCFLVLALLVTLVWSICDRQRPNYTRLKRWLIIYLRFALACDLILYGTVKVIKTQFPAPPLNRLVQQFGDASPMGLLWTFMGHSEPYTVFTGAAEMVGGILLMLPQTALLGALVLLGVLVNIFMLNMSYDVPVKLYSLHLLIIALFLTAQHARRLANLFLFNRRVAPVEDTPLFDRQWLNRATVVLRFVFAAYIICFYMYQAYEGRKSYGDWAPKPPLYGIWNVEEFELNGEVRPPLLTDETRWRRMVFQFKDFTSIHPMQGARQVYVLELDMEKRQMTLKQRNEPKWQAQFSFQQPEPELMTMEGTLNGQPARMKLRRVDETKFLLNSRGFHWINEYPFNR